MFQSFWISSQEPSAPTTININPIPICWDVRTYSLRAIRRPGPDVYIVDCTVILNRALTDDKTVSVITATITHSDDGHQLLVSFLRPSRQNTERHP